MPLQLAAALTPLRHRLCLVVCFYLQNEGHVIYEAIITLICSIHPLHSFFITKPGLLAQHGHLSQAGPMRAPVSQQGRTNSAWNSNCSWKSTEAVETVIRWQHHRLRKAETELLRAAVISVFPKPAWAALLVWELVQRPFDTSFLLVYKGYNKRSSAKSMYLTS